MYKIFISHFTENTIFLHYEHQELNVSWKVFDNYYDNLVHK
jgi:hypothetical protein